MEETKPSIQLEVRDLSVRLWIVPAELVEFKFKNIDLQSISRSASTMICGLFLMLRPEQR